MLGLSAAAMLLIVSSNGHFLFMSAMINALVGRSRPDT